MSLPKHLSTRLSLVILLAIAVGSIVFGMLFYSAYDRMEHEMLNALVDYMSVQESASRKDDTPDAIETGVVVYDGSETNFPVALRSYQYGFHHNLRLNKKNYHLAVTGSGADKKFVLFDITDIEREERKIGYFIGFAALLMVMSVGWLVFWLSKSVLSPVKSFANQIAAIEPGKRNIRLAAQYREVEVEEIATSFDRFMQRLDEFIDREQFFTSAASHELRTPLSIIMTSTELLESRKEISESSRIYLKRIHRSAEEMSNIISALLFLSRERIQHERLNWNEETSLVDVVNYTLRNFNEAGLAASTEMTVDEADDSHVNVLFSHVYIVLRNVLSNAIKYGKGAPISIRVNEGCVYVTDFGDGIAEKEYEQLYQRGFKGAESQGQGLGLFIVKSFCDYYGWKIAIQSKPSKGTTVSIDFAYQGTGLS